MALQAAARVGTTKPPSENRKLILALSGIVLSILMTSLDGTIVGTAMPRIIEELQGFSLYTWVTTVYLLTSTATIPVAGKLGDMFGRKYVVLVAVAIFLTGSALCGAAPSMFWLVVFRGLQGVGAGCLQANTFASISDLIRDPGKRARWQGFMAALFGLTTILGPVVGGVITDNFNWRWVFYVNLPVGLLAVGLLIFALPHLPGSGTSSIDWWGAATIVGTIVSLLLALSWGGQKEPNGYQWFSPQILGLFGVSVVLFILFIFIERKAAEPIVPLRLFAIPMVRSVSVISFGQNLIMLGTLLFIGLYMQVVLGQSASSSGVIVTPLVLALITANILTGQFIGRVGLVKLPIVVGTLGLGIGTALLLTLDRFSSIWQVAFFIIIIGLALGTVGPSLTIGVQELVERRDLGVATSTVQFFGSIGSTVGTGLIGSIVTGAYLSNVTNSALSQTLPPQTLELIQGPQNLLSPQIASSLPLPVIELAQQSLVNATHSGFLVCLGVAVIAFLGVLTVPDIRIKGASRQLQQAKAAGLGEPSNTLSSLERSTHIVKPDGATVVERPIGTGGNEKGSALITITYQVGSGGPEIGQAVARELGLDYVDRQIVQEAAQKIGISLVGAGNEPMDESILGIRPGFISILSQANPTAIQALANSGGYRPLEELDYHQAIQMVIEETARRERVLIAGYRANFALEGRAGMFNIYIYAPAEMRVQKVMVGGKLSYEVACEVIKQQDFERAEYIRRVYGKRWDDPAHYHLMINTQTLEPEIAVDLITRGFQKSKV